MVYWPEPYCLGCIECAVVSRFALTAVYTAVSSGQLCSGSTVGPRVCCCMNDSSDTNSEPCQTLVWCCEVDCGGCGLCDRLITAVYRNKNRNPANKCRLPQRTYTTYRYLSSDNIEWWKVLRYVLSQTVGLVKGISTPIVRNNRFRLAVPLLYRPNRHALEIPIDSYLFQRSVLILDVNTVLAEQ